MLTEKVLIVDDDPAVQKVLKKVLASNGLEPSIASSGEEALGLLKNGNFDLMILDIMLKGIDGFDVLQTVRNSGSDLPVMILSGRSEDYDTLYGLSIGGDDYVTKPFNPVLLGAKAKALIRRSRKSGMNRQEQISAGPFQYNPFTMKLYKSGKEIPLSAKENMMMQLFLHHIDQVFSKEQLYEQVWGDSITDENAVMVYISHLRNKIEDNPKNPIFIKTVWGLGYKFTVGSQV